ncbi:hypothetical protein [Mesorhizobium sp.]|uniref:hypothetical protein n=1 Tax=Mesorhizobium sp. TaxID=1871066 RepID=UPI0025DEA257|nr:hypothetical protein [Mesorhizobium sp.]
MLQYAMRDRITALGWSRIDTIDDDLWPLGRRHRHPRRFRPDGRRDLPWQGWCGCGARGLALCCNSRDWQQLIEMCRVVDTDCCWG